MDETVYQYSSAEALLDMLDGGAETTVQPSFRQYLTNLQLKGIQDLLMSCILFGMHPLACLLGVP